MTAIRFSTFLFISGLIVACVDQFALHGTAFEWTSPAHSTWGDGCAFGLLAASFAARFWKRAVG